MVKIQLRLLVFLRFVEEIQYRLIGFRGACILLFVEETAIPYVHGGTKLVEKLQSPVFDFTYVFDSLYVSLFESPCNAIFIVVYSYVVIAVID